MKLADNETSKRFWHLFVKKVVQIYGKLHYICTKNQTILVMEKFKLKQVRAQKGFTQQQVAEALFMDVSNYSRKENGHVGITKEEWKRLATFLQVSEEEIYQENEATINNAFFDNSSITNQSSSISTQNIGIPTTVLEHLLDYIALLKEENERLKSEAKDK